MGRVHLVLVGLGSVFGTKCACRVADGFCILRPDWRRGRDSQCQEKAGEHPLQPAREQKLQRRMDRYDQTPKCGLRPNAREQEKVVQHDAEPLTTEYASAPGDEAASRISPNLLCCYQRMSDGVDGERDAILDADLAHQFRDVRLHGAFFDAEG